MRSQIQDTLYNDAERLLVAVDCIIFGFDKERLKLLLFKRKIQPFKDEWSLIGSFVKKNENVSSAAERVLEEFTGINGIFMKELHSFGSPDRDPGGRVLSIAHYALIRLDEQKEHSVQKYEARWFDIDDIPTLILDHSEMVRQALDKLRSHAKYFPVGFELLPAKFTIPQLKRLYEAIYQKKVDRRNFRKKFKSMKILDQLDEKDMSGSKKGAFLYRFNQEKYHELLEDGFIFEI